MAKKQIVYKVPKDGFIKPLNQNGPILKPIHISYVVLDKLLKENYVVIACNPYDEREQYRLDQGILDSIIQASKSEENDGLPKIFKKTSSFTSYSNNSSSNNGSSSSTKTENSNTTSSSYVLSLQSKDGIHVTKNTESSYDTLDFDFINYRDDLPSVVNHNELKNKSYIKNIGYPVDGEVIESSKENGDVKLTVNDLLKPGSWSYSASGYNSIKKDLVGNDTIGIAKRNNEVSTTLEEVVKWINETLGIQNSSDTPKESFKKLTKYYNRFKKPLENLGVPRGFGHVFFIKPCCNIFNENRTALNNYLIGNQMFLYAFNKYPELLKELSDVITSNTGHNFMLSFSNFCTGLSIDDESLATESYGKSYTGFQITYGKHNNAFKTAGTLNLSFTETRDLQIYHLHKLWMEYISKCYRGQITPKLEYIASKTLDYASAVYYIVTAEDGETILYWSKFYGVFPTGFPTSEFSFTSGDMIKPSDRINITYAYSFREDFDPDILMEFNYNAGITGDEEKLNYTPLYDPKLGHSGRNLVGAPYIELVKNGSDGSKDEYTYKLRFRTIEEEKKS